MNHKMRTKSSQLQLSVGKPSDNPRQGGLTGRVSDVHFTMLHAMLMSSSEGEQEDTHAYALPPLSHRPGHEGWQDQSVNLQHDPAAVPALYPNDLSICARNANTKDVNENKPVTRETNLSKNGFDI